MTEVVIAGMRSAPEEKTDTSTVSKNNRTLAATVDAVHTPELFADLDREIANLNIRADEYARTMERVLLLVNRLRIASGTAGGLSFGRTMGEPDGTNGSGTGTDPLKVRGVVTTAEPDKGA